MWAPKCNTGCAGRWKPHATHLFTGPNNGKGNDPHKGTANHQDSALIHNHQHESTYIACSAARWMFSTMAVSRTAPVSRSHMTEANT